MEGFYRGTHKIWKSTSVLILWFILGILPFSGGAQSYCVPSYSGPGNPNTGSPTPFFTHLLRVQFGEIDHSLPPPSSQNFSTIFHDLSNITTQVVPKATYPLIIKVGNGANTQRISVWIDYNQNKIFETTEEVFSQIDTANRGDHILRTQVFIPANARLGTTRIRIGTKLGIGKPDPCNNNGSQDWSQDFRDYGVEVVKPVVQKFKSLEAFQSNSDEVEPGSRENLILGIRVNTNAGGIKSPLTVDSFRFSTIGCTDVADITRAKLFYSGKYPEFLSSNQVGSTIQGPGTYFSVGANQKLKPGVNYFWLTYDIRSGALIGNQIDARCKSAYIISQRIPSEMSPSGNRDVGYCTSKGNKSRFVYINRVQMGNIRNYSFNNGGFGNYTYYNTNIERGKKEQLSVEVGNGVNDNQTLAWIDFNHDGDFFDNGERVFRDSIVNLSANNQSLGPVTDSISVPLPAKIGPTRMRITSNYRPNFGSTQPGPCSNPVEVGEVEDYTVTIAEDGEPVANFVFTTECVGEPVRFYERANTFGSYSITSYKWNFGDGDTSTQANPSHTYSSGGVYYVSLVVNTNKPGTPDTLIRAVQVHEPKAGFTVNHHLADKPVIFTDETTGANVVDYDWNFGDPLSGNNQASGEVVSHTYDSMGGYLVRLVVTASGGCLDTFKKFLRIDTVIPPTAYFTSPTLNPFYNQKIKLQDLSVNDPSSWNWKIRPPYVSYYDNTDSTSQNPVLTFDSLTRYRVTLEAKNAAGKDTFSRVIRTKDYTKPIADFSATPTRIKAGQMVSFLDLSENNPVKWNWTFGDGDTSHKQHPHHAYHAKGSFTVALAASNPKGKDTRVKTNYITVVDEYRMCEVDVPFSTLFKGNLYDEGGPTGNYMNNSNCGFLIKPNCAGPITLSFNTFDLASGDYLRVYDGKDETGVPLHPAKGFTGTSTPSSVTANSGFMYIVHKTDGNTTGAGFTASWSAVPNIKPNVSINASSTAYINSPLRLKAIPIWGTGNTYYWDFDYDGIVDDSSGKQVTHIFDSTGTFTIKLVVKNCKGQQTVLFNVSVKQPTAVPKAKFTVSKDTVLPYKDVALIDQSTNGPTQWKWGITPPYVLYMNNTTDSSMRPVVQFYESGDYDISLQVSNQIGTGPMVTKVDAVYVKETAMVCIYPYENSAASGRVYDSGGEQYAYGNREDCGLLLNPCAKKVILNFREFDLDVGDYLKIYDGKDENGIPFHSGSGYTGNSGPSRLVANSGNVYLKMTTNFSGTADGFIADWQSVSLDKPEADFSAPDTAYTGGNIAFFNNESRGKGNMYIWDYEGQMSWMDTVKNGQHKYNQPGWYSVRMIAKNCAGEDTLEKRIRVLDPSSPPEADFVADRENADVTDRVTFRDASDNGPNQWKWDFYPSYVKYMEGNDTSARPVVSFDSSGKYDVRLIVSNALGTDTVLKKDFIRVFEYCEPSPQAGFPDVGISRVTVADMDNLTKSGRDAYNDYTRDYSSTLEIGGHYAFRIERPTNSNNVDRKIWIDFNQDGDFEDNNELVAKQINTGSTVWTDSLRIPVNALKGPTRLRVGSMVEGYQVDPCGPNLFGEFEDYRIFITGDHTPPVIRIIGKNPYFTEIGVPYNDPGAKAWDWVDGNLTSQIMTTNNIDTGKLGTYYVRYNVTDSAGNKAKEAERTVVVIPDRTKPTITLQGPDPQIVGIYTSYAEHGAKAIDNRDGDVSGNIRIQSNVDTSRVDTYEVIYTAYDYSGNYADPVTRTVYVKDTTAPIVYLEGSDTVKLWVESSGYRDSGIKVYDNYYQGDFTVDTFTNLNLFDTGTYFYRYYVTDLSGNTGSSKDRTIIVRDSTTSLPPGGALTGRVRVYPNPTAGSFRLHVSLVKKQQTQVQLFNSLGEKIKEWKSQPVKNKIWKIDLTGNSPGVYFIHINTPEKNYLKPVEVQH